MTLRGGLTFTVASFIATYSLPFRCLKNEFDMSPDDKSVNCDVGARVAILKVEGLWVRFSGLSRNLISNEQSFCDENLKTIDPPEMVPADRDAKDEVPSITL
jgi:hypothetical protein